MNRIIIQYEGGYKPLEIPITEDFQIEASTEFSSFADLAPTISSLVDLGNTFTTTANGEVTSTGLKLRSVLDAPRWQRTNPVRITLDMFFYTRTSALENVVLPLEVLIGSHIIKRGKDNKLKVPGLNALNVKNIDNLISGIKNKETRDDFVEEEGGKEELKKLAENQVNSLFSVIIPGVVYLPKAFVFAIQPTYSKQVTDEGYPLWASANVQIQSLTPALAEYFETGRKFNNDFTTRV